jgi:hypothetical protein
VQVCLRKITHSVFHDSLYGELIVGDGRNDIVASSSVFALASAEGGKT